jgi:alkylation response protein AidB-like acyl-CoA dehydrogenase
MDFSFTEGQRRLREEVRSFLKRVVTPEVVKETESHSGLGPHSWDFMRRVGARGWLCPTWPKQYGGLEASNIDRLIIWDEIAYHGAMEVWAGVRMAGPTILLFGNDEQKREWLPPIANGEIDFAAGLTEPDAGSDVAAIRLRAVEDGDDYVLNGQKTFNTGCHFAQYHWLGTKTDADAPRHRSLSLFVVDMKSPGITIRPQWTSGGWRTNEVFYDDVRVPKRNMVGEKNRGFQYLAASLDFDRVSVTGRIQRSFEELVRYAQETRQGGAPLGKYPLVRNKLADLAVELEIVRCLTYRHAWLRDRGLIPNYEASVIKVLSAGLTVRVFQRGTEMVGLYGQLQGGSKWALLDGRIEHGCRSSIHRTIVGGTAEIMRNIIASRGLGLPAGA